jgi:hypothetical protein
MIRWPFVSRHIYEQVLQERNRLLDKLMQQSFGFQLHDSFSGEGPQVAATVVGPEPEPAQETEEEIRAREQAELISTARTRPSNLAAKMEQLMRARFIRRAKAATTVAHPEVKARFEQIKSDVLKAKTVH